MSQKLLLSLLFAATVFSCSQPAEQKKTSGKLQGLHKHYYPDGELYLEISYRDSVPHGTFRQYFKNGQLFEETEYRNGIRHGRSRKYYENGKLSGDIEYDSGRMHGVHRKYRKDGTLAFEAPYHYDHPCKGLKEFYLSGTPVTNYPSIVVKPVNELLKESRYTLRVSLSDKNTRVEFFRGQLKDGKYIDENTERIVTSNGVGSIYYFLPPGAFVMEKINIIAKVKTDLSNYYITTLTYNLAAQNQ